MKVLKQNKFWFYIHGYALILLGSKDLQQRILELEKKLTPQQLENAEERIDYYCKISNPNHSAFENIIKDLKKPKSPKAYYFDTYEYARFFDENLPINFVFGDVIHIPEIPSIVKSRPISEHNENSVLLNLDKARHFVRVVNDQPFSKKKNMLIGRGAIFENQHNRIQFYEKYFHHPLCDLGQTNSYGNFGWQKPKLSIEAHLNYKYVLSLQGNDVATNLKWIMSSNSIAVMPKPTMETWYIEGKLIPNVHFIEISEDFSNVENQLEYYNAHPKEAEFIMRNAQKFRSMFFDKNLEDYCSLKVLEKYLMKF